MDYWNRLNYISSFNLSRWNRKDRFGTFFYQKDFKI